MQISKCLPRVKLFLRHRGLQSFIFVCEETKVYVLSRVGVRSIRFSITQGSATRGSLGLKLRIHTQKLNI